MSFSWWAITGSNWFRREHVLKERSDAQDIVNRGCRRLNDIGENGKTKRHYGAKHIVSFLVVGDNRIELLTFCL